MAHMHIRVDQLEELKELALDFESSESLAVWECRRLSPPARTRGSFPLSHP